MFLSFKLKVSKSEDDRYSEREDLDASAEASDAETEAAIPAASSGASSHC